MTNEEIAPQVLAALGGRANVAANAVCITRLRVEVKDAEKVDHAKLNEIRGVLGIVDRGGARLEVVFGPRMIGDVYRSFIALTGIEPDGSTAPYKDSDDSSSMKVRISPTRKAASTPDSGALGWLQQGISLVTGAKSDAGSPAQRQQDAEAEMDDRDMLQRLLDDEERPQPPASTAKVLVINGPNINMLGIREPGIYGREDFATLLETCKKAAADAGFSSCECYQSNHEGDLVDRIQDAYGTIDGIVINPGAYTHTSVAILDALKAVSIPAVEVHISKVDEREEFRQVSYVRAACFETIAGMGIEGYRKAIFDLADHLGLR